MEALLIRPRKSSIERKKTIPQLHGKLIHNRLIERIEEFNTFFANIARQASVKSQEKMNLWDIETSPIQLTP